MKDSEEQPLVKPEKPLTAQEKGDRGLVLSGADITELMKDPNSWVYKLYVESQKEAAITKAQFIAFVEMIMLELALAGKEKEDYAHSEANKKETHREYLQQQLEPLRVLAQQDPALKAALLKIELQVLLSVSQRELTADQLDTHHQQLMTHLSEQMRKQIGPNLIVPVVVDGQKTQVSLIMPQGSLTQVPVSRGQVIAHQPDLATRIMSDPKDKRAAINSLDNAENLAYLINEAKDIIKHNYSLNPDSVKALNITDPEHFNLPPSLIKALDRQRVTWNNENQPFSAHLKENGLRSLEEALGIKLTEQPTPSVAKQVAPSPTSAQSVKEEEVIENIAKRPIGNRH